MKDFLRTIKKHKNFSKNASLRPTNAAVPKCSVEQLLHTQNSKENSCVAVIVLANLYAYRLQLN